VHDAGVKLAYSDDAKVNEDYRQGGGEALNPVFGALVGHAHCPEPQAAPETEKEQGEDGRHENKHADKHRHEYLIYVHILLRPEKLGYQPPLLELIGLNPQVIIFHPIQSALPDITP
jgi:hypothetical protein